jgi:disulfide bond formation protein DsbB
MSRVRHENDPAYRAGGLALALAVASILTALGFEHLGGLEPCPLCLQQRYAFYVGIPGLFLGMVLLAAERPRAAAVLFLAVGLAFLANTGLGAYHAGVEWKFWPGPDTCAPATETLKPLSGGNLLNDLAKTRVVRCDEAPWRFLGLSFAGWNVLGSFIIFITAVQAAAASRRVH